MPILWQKRLQQLSKRQQDVNILQNNGEVAGQSVFHLHIHVIPRYDDDDAHIKWTPGTQDTEGLDKIAAKVKEIL